VGDAGNPVIMELPGGSLTATPVFFDSTTVGAAALPGPIGDVAIDASGNIWAANYLKAGQGVSELVKGTGGYTGVNYPLTILGGSLTYDIAIDGAGNPWVLVKQSTAQVFCVVPMNSSGAYLASTTGGANGCLGSATLKAQMGGGFSIDSSGNLWMVNEAAVSVFEVVGAAVPVTTPHIGYARPLS